MSTESLPLSDNSAENNQPPHVPVYAITEEHGAEPLADSPEDAFEEIPYDDAPPDDELPDAALLPAPAAPLASPGARWMRALLVGVTLLVWLALAFKVFELMHRETQAPVASVATQKRVAPLTTKAPRAAIRRRIVPAKRRVAVSRKHPLRSARRGSQEKRSIILGRGAVLEDDKSIIRIHD